MPNLTGFRTLIVAALALLWAVFDKIGVPVPLDDQEAIATGVLAIIMVILRFVTKTPIGKKD